MMIQRTSELPSPPRSQDGAESASPSPWEVIEATEHHGPYIVNAYGGNVCDFYAMSNPMAASLRNGGKSFPVPFTNAAANAALVVKAVNLHGAMAKRIARLESDLEECLEYFKDRYDVVDGDYGEPRANREMQLGTMLDETLNGRDF